jgi:hypothetical protein
LPADGRCQHEKRQRRNQPDKRHRRPWRNKEKRDERQRRQQMGGGGVRRGNKTTSQTRGARGDGMERGMTRGDGAMSGKVADRWEVVV